MTIDSYGDVTARVSGATRFGRCRSAGQHRVVRVAGPDAESFLDSLLSQDLAGLDDGTVVRSLLLGPRGKLRALLWVARFGEEFLLLCDDVEPGTRWSRISLDSSCGCDARDRANRHRSSIWSVRARERRGRVRRRLAGGPGSARDAEQVLRRRRRPARTWRERRVRLAASPMPPCRVEMGEPVMGRSMSMRAPFPRKPWTWPTTVSFTKGCYLGQELVARIDSRGHVNRHLRGVVLAENALPPEGAEVFADGTAVGSITSVSESLQVGAPIGLGLIRREVEPGSPVEIRWEGGPASAEVRALPLL